MDIYEESDRSHTVAGWAGMAKERSKVLASRWDLPVG
jgi:hypothetical protein